MFAFLRFSKLDKIRHDQATVQIAIILGGFTTCLSVHICTCSSVVQIVCTLEVKCITALVSVR